MITVTIILILVFAIAIISEIHALGLWLFMMITHGFLVEEFGPVAEHLPMYAGLMIMGITVIRGKWSGMPPQLWLLLSCLIAFIALAAIWGLDPPYSIKRLILYSKGFVLAIFIGGVIKNDSQIQRVTLYCVAAVFAGSCIAIYQHFSGAYSIDIYDVQRAAGLSGDPNDTAMLLLTGIPLSVYWLTHSRKRYAQLAFAIVFVSIIAAITLTQSRGGGVALLLILLLFYLKRPTAKSFAIGMVFLLSGLLFASTEYLDRMESLRTTGDSTDASLEARYQFVVSGIEIFWNNPILGVGMGNYGKALVVANPNYGDEYLYHVAHNMYLEFFVENGFFAGLLFLVLLVSAIVYANKYDKRNFSEVSAYGIGFCVSMSLVAVMTAGLFLSHGRSSVLWFLVGLGLAFRATSTNYGRIT